MGALKDAVREGLMVETDVRSIDFTRLRSMGVSHAVFDVENTLELITHGPKTFRPETAEFLHGLHYEAGMQIAFATNSTGDFSPMRLALQLWEVPAPFIQPGPGKKPRKPWLEYYQMVLERVGAQPHEAVMIGDKLMYDCVPAIRAGMYGVWVRRLGRDLTFAGIPVEAPRRWAEGLHRRRFGLVRP